MTDHSPRSAKSAKAFDYLRSRIETGEWPVNSRIPREPELMKFIGVGKSTLREAVQSLTGLGMLEPLRGIGTFVRSRTPVRAVLVSSISGYSLEDILELRSAIEVEAARQAALRRSDEEAALLRRLLREEHNAGAETSLAPSHGQAPGAFHQQLLAAAGNPLLQDLYAGAIAAIREKKKAGLLSEDDDPAMRHDDHEAIAAAVERREPSAAANAMARHTAHDIVPSSPATGTD